MTNLPTIALLTDFGTSDAYVGTMKGVMLAICPEARLIDLTHTIAPQNVRQAAYVLLTAYRYFPPETVFLAVIDPGVGTARDPIAVATSHGRFIVPNNGLLSYVLARETVHESAILSAPAYQLNTVSQTFHGRDIFAPAAAHLAAGVPVSDFGPVPDSLVTFDPPALRIEPTGGGITAGVTVHGEVMHVDHFGNVITSIGALHWIDPVRLHLSPLFGTQTGAAPETLDIDAGRAVIHIGGQQIDTLRKAYGMVSPGEMLALVGSTGQLEIGINQGHAARALSIAPGDPVALHLDG